MSNLAIYKNEREGGKKTSKINSERSNVSINKPLNADSFLLQRKAGCACGGECPHCREEALPLQPKLEISQPHDMFEQEADRVADQIMGMSESDSASEPKLSRHKSAGSLQRKYGARRAEESLSEEKEEEKIAQRKEKSSRAINDASAIGNMSQGGGQPLSASVRSFFEPRFGIDLSSVRVHTDAQAHKSAQSVNAVAYTIGSDIVFNQGRYAPDTSAGRRLLAHELTHVLQQSGGMINRKLDVHRISPMVQRQQVTCAIDFVQLAKLAKGDKGAALEVLNCCESGVGPLPSGCTQDAVAAAKKLLGKDKGPKKADCRGFTGFRPANSKEFMGQCCRGEVKTEFGGGTTITGIESKENCCPPERIATGGTFVRCCNEHEIVQGGLCTEKPEAKACPPDKTMTIMGTCVDKPKIKPPDKPDKPDKPPDKPPAPFTTVDTVVIEFKKDEPQSWTSFKNSVTSKGQTQFDALVALLNAQPEAQVQLEAHASSEKPEGDADYNKRLTDRRVKIIFDELKKKKIDSARITNPPEQAAPAGCEELAAGQLSCGDVGANPTADPADRKVVAKIFTVTK